MKRFISFALLIVMLFSFSSNAIAEEGTHLFILTGQSNMRDLDPSQSFIPTVRAEFGPENVIVVKDADGGQPIRRWYKDWKSSKGNRPSNTGDLYDRLMKMVSDAIEGEKITSVCVMWMQGERDAAEGWGDVYAESLQGLIEQFSSDLNRTDLNFVIGRISDFDMKNQKYQDWTTVRKAQMKVAQDSENVTWINTDDLNGKQDKLHYTGKGYKTLGKRFANQAISMIDQP